MRLNNKGTSLMELIVSIALISVILVFMIRLLVDLNDTETNNDFAKNNQLIRAEIIRAIENDLNNKVITNIDGIGSTANNLIINFKFKDNTSSKIDATSNTIEYTNTEGDLRKWTLAEGTIYTPRAKVYFATSENAGVVAEDSEIYTMLIDIEIHTANEKNTFENNNTLDDILLNYIGKVNDLENKNLKDIGYNS